MDKNFFWNNVLWSDETKIELNNLASCVWRQKGCVYGPKGTITTVKYSGRSVMTWRFYANGTKTLHVIEGPLDEAMYRDILEEN